MESFHSVKNNCLKAQQLGIKTQHNHKVGMINWLKLKYHLLYCRICRTFLTKSRNIDRLLEQGVNKNDLSDAYTLSDSEKQKMQEQINKIS
jgi:hypothetical protein